MKTPTRPFWTKTGEMAHADPRWLTQPGGAAQRVLSIATDLLPEEEALPRLRAASTAASGVRDRR